MLMEAVRFVRYSSIRVSDLPYASVVGRPIGKMNKET
jgi:hypothetical protein